MRGEKGIVELPQGRHELLFVGARLHREYVYGRAPQAAVCQAGCQGIDIHHGAAGSVDQDTAGFHVGQLGDP